jgi:hypothetical protein
VAAHATLGRPLITIVVLAFFWCWWRHKKKEKKGGKRMKEEKLRKKITVSAQSLYEKGCSVALYGKFIHRLLALNRNRCT